MPIPETAADRTCIDDTSREEGMLLTIEKVAILKPVDIFADTPDYVLASVAAIVEEVDLV
ncbi:hypothetical protein KFU94_66805 [Chloroflexi bacterium TSY]|nr:hypothetical protein [Chloroflexi bacterium TSY]